MVVMLGALLAMTIWASFASAAQAADRVYFVNGNTISLANADGSGGGDLDPSGASVSGPYGVAIDPAAGRIYWANTAVDSISSARLDGTGGGANLNTAGATLNNPKGVAIDSGARRIYWANQAPADKISFANLDGSGGGDLSTAGATVSGPVGVAIDPAAGRIYWASNTGHKISFANLDGSGGADLDTTGANVGGPTGLALDVAADRLYWAVQVSDTIAFASLSGGGGGALNTAGATVNGPVGVTIDSAAERIYWGNTFGDAPGVETRLSFARLDGSGGGDLNTTGAALGGAKVFPVLLNAPVAAGAPVISGGSEPGSVLSCSPGSWAPDLVAGFLYRAPLNFSYRWSRGGGDIAGAVGSSYTADNPGEYRCTATGLNTAGGTTQQSGPHAVSEPSAGGAPPPPNARPSVSGFTASSRVFAAVARGGRITRRTNRRVARGTIFRYRLSEAARVVIVVERAVAGRRVGKLCRKPTPRIRPTCTRYLRSGVLRSRKNAGRQANRFSGRFRARALRPGRYRARIVATDAQGATSATRRLKLRVVRP
jgi:DNA-binding beta-propeller fold protein YncE